MSRIIVKNLPKKISAQKLKELFSSKGYVTDLQLKYTKGGVFRQFAFVGYKTEEEAQEAKEYFHNTFVNASRIQVDICANLGDSNKPRAWSKYAVEKLLPEEAADRKSTEKSPKFEKKKKKFEKTAKTSETHGELEKFPDELKNDALFAEFLEVNKARTSKPLWSDTSINIKTDDYLETNKISSDDDNESEEEELAVAKERSISDSEYLKMKKEPTEKTEMKPFKESISSETSHQKKTLDDSFTVKLRNLPFKCKKKQIKQFFYPLKPASLRIPPKSKGFAYVKFKTEKEMKQALSKNKGFLDGHRIDVIKYEKKESEASKIPVFSPEDKEKSGQEIVETGRIFVRNLCFSVTEDELTEVFSKYGPLSEVHLPIDAYSKKGLGFAFVSFMFADHAVKAFAELDGSIFQGRLLHLIPAKPKKEISVEEDGSLSFKKKKEAKLKALSGSSHNWNTLFLGINAVADVISKKYNIEKSKLLDDETNESVAVRMALGETQLVVETRKFLLENGVCLDSFSQAASERSKTVIIAKNLPANTLSKEVLEVFSKHGLVSRVVLPPCGVTALIEYQEPTEAKTAFKRLAYSRFHHVPLYLEWAPMNVFSSDIPPKVSNNEKQVEAEQKNLTKLLETKEGCEGDEEDYVIEPEPGSVLFIKNLNFETTEDSLEKHFKKCGAIHSVSISKKKDLRTGRMLSMGFGFIHFKHKSAASKALQDLQNSDLDGHKLELKFSNKATLPRAEAYRKKAKIQAQKSSKILVRNIPFEVTEKEMRDLFKEFGLLKSVRLPKKAGEGTHRGFGFIDFNTKNDAKRAFDALCHSTHLLGRRLVLEWANPEAEEVSELRKKTAREFYAGGPKTKLKKSKLMEDIMLAASKVGTDDAD